MALTAAQKKAAFKNQSKKNAKKWKENREATGGGFDLPKIEEGRFQFKLTGDYGVGDKGKLKAHAYVKLIATKAVTCDGGEEGETIEQFYDLTRAATAKFDPQKNMVRDLKRLFPAREEEITGYESPGDAADLIDELNADPILVWGTVKHTMQGEGEAAVLQYVNINFNGPVEDGAADPDADPAIDPDEPGTDDDEPQVEDDEVQIEDEPADDWEPAKGNKVTFLSRGKAIAGVVVTSNRADQTARVKGDKDGRTYAPQKWDKLTFVSVS